MLYIREMDFAVPIYTFFIRPFFCQSEEKSSNAAMREKQTHSLIFKLFILREFQSLVNNITRVWIIIFP